jgi:8-oxo-dGTP pyrophosphatase MutT (NUDIX family)
MNLGEDTEDVCGVIVLYRNKILLIRGSGGKWSFPKGRRRENETFLEGALREAKEEAGLDLSGICPDVTLKLRYGTYFIFNLWRIPELENPTTPEEVLEVAWHNFQSMRDKEKNADLKCYFKLKKTGNLKRTCDAEKSTLWTQRVF